MTRWITGKHYQGNTHNVYHTDPDCQYKTPNSKTLAESNVDTEDLRECKFCAGTAKDREMNSVTCPYCGETVSLLPDHLPCEASQ